MGARIATLHRKAGLSQAQLAEALRVPQRTLFFYEREAGDIPAGLAPQMAKALEVSTDGLPDLEWRNAARGTKPSRKILRRMQQVEKLPAARHALLLKTIDTFIKAAGK
jgi:transcriptional regulator with XRE-family HTH domain